MPSLHRFSENIYVYSSFLVNFAVPGAVGAAGVGPDTLQFRRGALVVDTNAGGSATTFDVYLQESADGSTGWTTVASSGITQVLASTHKYQIIDIDLSKRMRYLRTYYTVGGGAVGYASAVFHLYQPANTNQPTQVTSAVHV